MRSFILIQVVFVATAGNVKKKMEIVLLAVVCIIIGMECEYVMMSHLMNQSTKASVAEIKKANEKAVAESHNPDNWWHDYCESEITIVDWNCGSDEMAFQLSDGTELYATKTENIYAPKFKSFVAFDEIQDMSKADDGTITITTNDGNSYTVNPSVKATEQGTQIK